MDLLSAGKFPGIIRLTYIHNRKTHVFQMFFLSDFYCMITVK